MAFGSSRTTRQAKPHPRLKRRCGKANLTARQGDLAKRCTPGARSEGRRRTRNTMDGRRPSAAPHHIATQSQVAAVLSKAERQQRLSSPIDVASSSLSCLPRNTQLYFRGFSELRQVASWLSEALNCENGAGLSATEECHKS